MGDEKKQPEAKKTLRDDEMTSAAKPDRRGILTTLGMGGMAAMVAGLASLLPRDAGATTAPTDEGHAPGEGHGEGETEGEGHAIAQRCTDRDSGRFADPPGRGRRCYRPRPQRRCTDRDSGRFADPPGRGRRC